MKKLRINPLVVADLKEIRDFIAEDNAEKAVEIIEKIYGKFENIQLFSDMGGKLFFVVHLLLRAKGAIRDFWLPFGS